MNNNEKDVSDKIQNLMNLKKSLERDRDELSKFFSDLQAALEKSSSDEEKVKNLKEVIDKAEK